MFLLLLRIKVLNCAGDMKKIVIPTISFPDHIVSIIKKRGMYMYMYSFWHNIIVDWYRSVDLFQDIEIILLGNLHSCYFIFNRGC